MSTIIMNQSYIKSKCLPQKKRKNLLAWCETKPLPGTGTLPVWVQGRSALPAGGYRREAKLLHSKIENFAA